jgi:hypothetical protein
VPLVAVDVLQERERAWCVCEQKERDGTERVR